MKNHSFSVVILCWLTLLVTPIWTIGAANDGNEQDYTRVAAQLQTPQQLPTSSVPQPGSAANLTTAIINVAQKTIPAVVHIDVTERQEVQGPSFPFENDPFFRYFFGIPETPRRSQRELKGIGTGMIIDAAGHILTNHHVAGGATKLEALLSNGHRYPAKLIGTDPKTDLAVIKIEAAEQLPYVTLGNSDAVQVGEWVVAIGHPQGLDQTVTQGIISAKHRQGVTDPSSYQDFLQTDTAINPGNSGGPLLNLRGEVIGVNAVIASQSGGFEGIGFAIPSNMAQHVANALLAHGKVERGWLGASVQDIPPDLVQSSSRESTAGALIAEVIPGGPAEKAAIRKGDLVLAVNGQEVPDANALRNMVASMPIGQEARLTVWRDGKTQQMPVMIGSQEEMNKLLGADIKASLGVEVRPLNAQERDKYGLDPDQGGLIITWLAPKGAFAQAGLEVNDLILEVNGQPVTDVAGLQSGIMSVPPQSPVVLLIVDHRTGRAGNVEMSPLQR